MIQKNILFIHPLGYNPVNAKTDISRKANIMPPLGLASIAAYLNQFQINSHIIDCYADPESDELVVKYLKNEAPAFIGFSCTTSSFLDGIRIAEYEKLSGYPSSYKLPIFNYPKIPNASCISSRGCPYSCSYCDRSVFRKSFRYNSAQYLYNHLKYLKDNFNIRHINFYDDQFTFNRPRVEEFARLMIQNPLKITFNCAARAEHLDFELLKLMKAAGCWMISLAKFTPFPGSPIYSKIKEQGEKIGIFTEDWEKMDCMQFLFIPKGLTKQKMEVLFIDFYKSHFKRTTVLIGYMSMIWRSPDSWIRFIKDIAGFLKFAFTNKRM